jgi:hypothetical protein
MPRKPIDYSTVYFYKIVCKDLSIEDCYVGSTTNFTRRKSEHKSRCKGEIKKDFDYRVYEFIRNNGNWENWDMILIETGSFDNPLDVKRRERELIEEYQSILNITIPQRSKKEYYSSNKEVIKNRSRTRYEVNKDKINERQNTKCNCECGTSYTLRNKSTHFKSTRHQQHLQQQNQTPETATPDSD